jgi:hypothetical protein
MPNGKFGDSPVTDMLFHDSHPFPDDIGAMVRKLWEHDKELIINLGDMPLEWEMGRDLDEGRAMLRKMMRENGLKV